MLKYQNLDDAVYALCEVIPIDRSQRGPGAIRAVESYLFVDSDGCFYVKEYADNANDTRIISGDEVVDACYGIDIEDTEALYAAALPFIAAYC